MNPSSRRTSKYHTLASYAARDPSLTFYAGAFGGGAIMYGVLTLVIREPTAFNHAQLVLSRCVALLIAGYAAVYLIRHLRGFLVHPGCAVNLAAFRVFYFGCLVLPSLFASDLLARMVSPWIGLPVEARVPIELWGNLTYAVPVTQSWVRISSFVLTITAWTSFLGLFTNLSLRLFYVAAFYLYLIPNLFGKINHTHDLLWITLILAFSPCGEMLSLDSLWKRFRLNGPRPRPGMHVRYGFPLRLIWLLIGIVYFFPGFWKLWDVGFNWAFSDNLKYLLYEKWAQLGSWRPIFRIDQYPVLLGVTGIGVLIFECSFIVLVIRDSTRRLAVAWGIFFHLAMLVFMRIFFVLILLAYGSFVDWEKIAERVRRVIGRARTSAAAPSPAQTQPAGSLGFGLRTVAVVLVSGNLLCGVLKLVNSWPFACYPTFSWTPEREKRTIHFQLQQADGTIRDLDKQILRDVIQPQRLYALEQSLLRASQPEQTNQMIVTFKTLWERSNVERSPGASLLVFGASESILPEAPAVPERRQHIGTVAF